MLISGVSYPYALGLDGNNHLFVGHFFATVGEYDATTGATINANFINGQGLYDPFDIVYMSAVPEPSSVVLSAVRASRTGCVGLAEGHVEGFSNPVRRESRRSPVGANPTRPLGRSAGSNQSGDGGNDIR